MSNRQNSTIGAKPNVVPNIEAWIGSNTPESTSQPASQQAIKPASNPASQPAEHEVMAMLSARIPAPLMRKLRIRAATEDRQIQDIVADLLRDYLGEE